MCISTYLARYTYVQALVVSGVGAAHVHIHSSDDVGASSRTLALITESAMPKRRKSIHKARLAWTCPSKESWMALAMAGHLNRPLRHIEETNIR